MLIGTLAGVGCIGSGRKKWSRSILANRENSILSFRTVPNVIGGLNMIYGFPRRRLPIRFIHIHNRRRVIPVFFLLQLQDLSLESADLHLFCDDYLLQVLNIVCAFANSIQLTVILLEHGFRCR